MRLSTDPNDPGYGAPISVAHVRILLDGDELYGCVITADEEQGLVVCQMRGPDGLPLYDKVTGRIDTSVLRGKVEIVRDETGQAGAAH